MKYLHLLKKFYIANFLPKFFEIFKKGYTRQELKKDVIAGLTTTVVSIPLSMALAIASGVSPAQGLYTAVIAGFFVALLGGSRFQIGGPTAAFVVVILSILQQSGYTGLATTMIIAGILLLLAGFFRLGDYIKYIPYPVVIGFTAGIGILLISTQVKDLLGLQIENVPSAFLPKWGSYFSNLGTISIAAVSISVLAVLIMVGVKKFFPKMPMMLFSVVGTSLVVFVLSLVWQSVSIDTIGNKFGALPHFLPKPKFPEFSLDLFWQMFPNGLTVAFLAGIESLLSAKVVDGMSGDNHNPNAELIGQGVANLACTAFTGIPATGAIARTATNFKAGAFSPVAGIMQSLFLLVFMLIFAPTAKYIPLACLSVILIMVGWNMLNLDKIKELLRSLPGDRLTLIATLFLTVFVDLNTAISVGFILASVIFMHRMSLEFTVETDDKTADERFEGCNLSKRLREQGVLTLRVSGPLFFGGVAGLSTFLRRLKITPKVLILRMNQVPIADASAVNLIMDFVKKMEAQGTRIIFAHIRKQPRRVLHEAFLREGLDWHKISVATNYTNALKMCRHILHQEKLLSKAA